MIFKRGKNNPKYGCINELHPNWKGDNVRMPALHEYIKARLPKAELCAICKKDKPLDCASKGDKYSRDPDDWYWICRSCHVRSDGRINNLKNQGAKK